jgi:hypothetical protein
LRCEIQGKYKVHIKQAVRENGGPEKLLEGITEVGLRIKKTSIIYGC